MGVENLLTIEFIITSLAITIRISPTILFASLGEVIAEKSGVVNLGTEGVMLITAFTAFYTSYFTGQPLTGLAAALLVGIVMGVIHSLLTVYLALNQVVVGLGVWIFGFGLPDILYRISFREVSSPVVSVLSETPIPILSDLPILGPILFRHNVLVYAALLFVPLVWLLLRHTNLGLKITATGENPRAAHSAGINVLRVRMLAVVIGAALAS
ncbi:MAG: ABC transporter permease, partial [Nitrososphaerota archaeon]